MSSKKIKKLKLFLSPLNSSEWTIGRVVFNKIFFVKMQTIKMRCGYPPSDARGAWGGIFLKFFFLRLLAFFFRILFFLEELKFFKYFSGHKKKVYCC